MRLQADGVASCVCSDDNGKPWVLPSIKSAEEKLVKEGWNGVFQKEYAGTYEDACARESGMRGRVSCARVCHVHMVHY